MITLSVGEVNGQIKALLESHFMTLAVTGEISNFTRHSSGHLYFSLKDESSSIKCVMFRSNASRVKFEPKNGDKVVINCSVTVYAPRGDYQLMCESMEPFGQGSLAVAYEKLKKKLLDKGYFDASRKKPLPKFPKKIALITSGTGAALQDMKRVAQMRWRLTSFTLFNTLVQGEEAKNQIVANLCLADTLGFDIIILARGGGSIEDLWAFNEEIVAEAVFAAKTPIVSAVGHEIDYLISDFVADLRAPTPSAAIEMILPDEREFMQTIDSMGDLLRSNMQKSMTQRQRIMSHLGEILHAKSPQQLLELKLKELTMLGKSLRDRLERTVSSKKVELDAVRSPVRNGISLILARRSNELASATRTLEMLEPAKKNSENFPMLTRDGKKIELSTLKKGDIVELQSPTFIASASIQSLSSIGA
jgi:exodeoxyribonuclease VII large subunit